MIPKSRSVSQTLDAHPFQRNVKWAITGSACSIPTVWSLETLCFYFLKHQASIKWELWLYSGSFLLVFLLSIDSSVSFWTLFTQQDLGPTAACVQQRWLRLKKKASIKSNSNLWIATTEAWHEGHMLRSRMMGLPIERQEKISFAWNPVRLQQFWVSRC